MSVSMLFNHSVVSDSLRPHGLQHTRLPCPSLSSWVCSNSCPLSWWCHPTISSSVIPFSSCLQSFPVSGSFLMSQLFQSGFQSIGASASASVLPIKIQDWFPLGLTSLICTSIYLPSYLSIYISICDLEIRKYLLSGSLPNNVCQPRPGTSECSVHLADSFAWWQWHTTSQVVLEVKTCLPTQEM